VGILRDIYRKNLQNAQILHDICPKKYSFLNFGEANAHLPFPYLLCQWRRGLLCTTTSKPAVISDKQHYVCTKSTVSAYVLLLTVFPQYFAMFIPVVGFRHIAFIAYLSVFKETPLRDILRCFCCRFCMTYRCDIVYGYLNYFCLSFQRICPGLPHSWK